MSDRVRDIINVEEEIKNLKQWIKKLKFIIMFLIIIIAIFTVILIGDYAGIWGGAMIEDPNCPGLPYTSNFLKLNIY